MKMFLTVCTCLMITSNAAFAALSKDEVKRLEEAAPRCHLFRGQIRILPHHLGAPPRELRIHYGLQRVLRQEGEHGAHYHQKEQRHTELSVGPSRKDLGRCVEDVHEVFPQARSCRTGLYVSRCASVTAH